MNSLYRGEIEVITDQKKARIKVKSDKCKDQSKLF